MKNIIKKLLSQITSLKGEKLEIRAILIGEEYKAEKTIAVIRLLLWLWAFLELFIISNFDKNEALSNMLWPNVFMVAISSCILIDVFLAGLKRWAKYFNNFYKYLIISIDVAALTYTILATPLGGIAPENYLRAIVFIVLIATILLSGVYRHSMGACIYAGVLSLISYTLSWYFYFGGNEGFYMQDGNYNWANGMVMYTILSLTPICAFISRRFRRIIITSIKRRQLERFLPEVVANSVLKGDANLSVGGQKKKVTILFSDIRNFTSMSESISPEELVDFLNSYLNDMIEVIFHYNGILDKIIGDGIMAVYGITDGENDAAHAVKTALDMMRKLEGLNNLREINGDSPIRIGIGIHTGEVIMGNIGSAKRMDYTAIGDAVNTASRLEGLTKKYNESIIISSQTKVKLNGEFDINKLDQVVLKGKNEPVEIFSVH